MQQWKLILILAGKLFFFQLYFSVLSNFVGLLTGFIPHSLSWSHHRERTARSYLQCVVLLTVCMPIAWVDFLLGVHWSLETSGHTVSQHRATLLYGHSPCGQQGHV